MLDINRIKALAQQADESIPPMSDRQIAASAAIISEPTSRKRYVLRAGRISVAAALISGASYLIEHHPLMFDLTSSLAS